MPRKRVPSLRCPTCKKLVLRTDPEFPFCSERCRLIDLGKWASGGYVISTPIIDPEEAGFKSDPSAKTNLPSADVPDTRSAAVPAAVSGASRPRFGEVTVRERGRLPHWEKEGATYFVTFRLADSLPASVLERIESERSSIIENAKSLQRGLTPAENQHIARLSTEHIENYLDVGQGACYLKHPSVAQMVANALQCFDEQRYRLFAWCVMPNHVHAVVRVFPTSTLVAVVHSWKSFTAKEANRILDRRGPFWQREYYDHLIRDQADFERCLEYVAENPRRAGLKDWPWVRMCGQDAHTTAGETPALRKQ
jgi:endogenous inhibitor of DNA gyrase (YacG/DUF329 family)/REP element-mobilizing transposase RayT